MTAVQLNANIQRNLGLLASRTDLMERVDRYVARLAKQVKPQAKVEEEEEYISKEELLAGIEQGLREVKEAMENGDKGMTMEEFLNEL